MLRSHGLLVLVLALALTAHADDETQTIRVKRMAKEVADAVLKEDYSKLVDLTYPKVVQAMGGREKMITATKGFMQQIKEQGFKMQSVTVGEPSQFLIEGANTFAVVPTKLEMTSKQGKIIGKSYLLGISEDGGKTWKFADGNGLDSQEKREKLLPKLPAKLKLPEKQQPKLIKE